MVIIWWKVLVVLAFFDLMMGLEAVMLKRSRHEGDRRSGVAIWRVWRLQVAPLIALWRWLTKPPDATKRDHIDFEA